MSLTIDELTEMHWLSVRSVNVCKGNDLYTLSDLLHYYKVHQTFKELRNCGEKSSKELTGICKYYERNIAPAIPAEHISQPPLEQWDPLKTDIVLRYVRSALSRLSVRAINGLQSENLEGIDLHWLRQLPELDFSNIKNIGRKTEKELIQFQQDIRDFQQQIIRMSGNDLRQTYLLMLIRSVFPQLSGDQEFDISGYFTPEGKIRLYALISHLLHKGLLFSPGRSSLFLDLYTGSRIPNLALIAEKHQLTRERIRQLKVGFLEDFDQHFGFLATFEAGDLVDRSLQNGVSVLIISRHWLQQTNAAEQVCFSAQFYAQVLSVIYKTDYERIEHTMQFAQKHVYYALIQRPLTVVFDFPGWLADLDGILQERIAETYELHFEGYLAGFFKAGRPLEFLEAIRSVCADLLFECFAMAVSADGFLVIEQNIRKNMDEYIVDALTKLGDLAHLEQIIDKLEELYPDLEWNESSVRGTMLREKDQFICIGRTSTFGLRVWEEERENLRGGSIRGMVELYLDGEAQPKHISELLNYVNQYRDTTENSLLTNLDADEHARFRIFPGEFIGLTEKTYERLPPYKRLNGVHFTGVQLKKMNSWFFDDVVANIVNKYGYLPIQVAYTLNKRIAIGDMILTADNRISI